ncbi:hypothetical protein GJ744_008153 [Endocarpon pusillum]|uniref:Agd3 deacetylase domain-containing protein n=1 Tax=Endocarpon pusillum TaxID=364733 RepID=A0A8H7E3K2_9EURO|nr:hypothetical protein GJ744_008153 [Endocarpon pusillum]
MVSENQDAFAHLSHTFFHEAQNNATYSDMINEIKFNDAWLRQTELSAGNSSSNGLCHAPAMHPMYAE